MAPDVTGLPTLVARAVRAAERARRHDAAGERVQADRCRRQAFAFLQFRAILIDTAPAPNQWLIERMIAAHIATDAAEAA